MYAVVSLLTYSRPYRIVAANTALLYLFKVFLFNSDRLRTGIDFVDEQQGKVSRRAGDSWLLYGPTIYYQPPWVEVRTSDTTL